MSDTYYGAPNDFRNYLEHRMDDYRWSSDKHKPRKGNDYNSNNSGKEQSAREKFLRRSFYNIAAFYTDLANRQSRDIKSMNNHFSTNVNQTYLRSKRNIYEACLTILRNNKTLSESQMDYIDKFIEDVENNGFNAQRLTK